MNRLIQSLKIYLELRERSCLHISELRKARLLPISSIIQDRIIEEGFAKILFICDNNSARSQFAQILTTAIAKYLSLPDIEAYSGGKHAAILHSNTIDALICVGFKIDRIGNENVSPKYNVTYCDPLNPILAFSKLYSDDPNPKNNFIAIFVNSLDENDLPKIPGAKTSVSLPYADLKVKDSTPESLQEYVETCELITIDLLFILQQVKDKLLSP
ncbi:low molecular weight phosphotyrosine protein phosphatase domain protein [Leptospira fainei serovar Hurstbridge str. BUT 6]|uniref:Low molecular weight phosphotyrosine protein phosphatase domain protein n=1 Tax=Leptospira fainei serovar Hurstbridge str. BUT 6 TaxID=1193011 RepID=S3V2Q0_9LEPT|nr:phosphotyrosine protein phosphatase [Leptospira fainei]EPG74909.1 low molecular weight phosphotyrosine protein phosphatase domain protein [Leptospira fainei serovar Hurstbridge str. BUT 6]